MKIDSKKVNNSRNKQLNNDYDFKDVKLLSSKTKKSSKKILTRTLLGIIAISGLSFIFMVGNSRSISNDSAKISPVTTQNTVKQDNTTPTLSQPGQSDLDKQLQESKQKADEAQQQAIQAQAAADKSVQDAQKLQAEQDAKYKSITEERQNQLDKLNSQAVGSMTDSGANPSKPTLDCSQAFQTFDSLTASIKHYNELIAYTNKVIDVRTAGKDYTGAAQASNTLALQTQQAEKYSNQLYSYILSNRDCYLQYSNSH